jgi:hypothetical protein
LQLHIDSVCFVVKKGEVSLKTHKILAVLCIIAVFLGLAAAVNPVSSQTTVVEVDPSLIEYHGDATGQQFTVAVKIIDVTNLYGFDIVLQWNTTFLAYVSHSTRVPKDTYSDGVLWNPVYPIEDQVNATAGTYWIAFACMYPAPTFNGSGTVFTITFQIIYQPVQPQPDANVTLHLYSSTSSSPDLSNNIGQPIPHSTQDGTVILYTLAASHDVAVTNLTAYKTVVGQGYTSNITVTVANQGNYAETFNVTAYANSTVIATIANITLASGDSVVQIIVWNTTGFAYSNYTLKAVADNVPGETDMADNNFTGGWVFVAGVGDLTGGTPNPYDFVPDGKVLIVDVSVVSKSFGQKVPPAPANVDLTGSTLTVPDGKVLIDDVATVAKHFGQHYSYP